jgi:hypothetical protein
VSETNLNKGYLDFVYDFYKGMKDHEITLAYEGEINQDIIKAFTSLAESNMSKNEEPENIQKKVYHVIVECLQNISRHASFPKLTEHRESMQNRGIVLICHNQNEYHVITGNLIEKSRKMELKDLLNNVNSLSVDELNQLYKDKLKSGHISDKGGAGLGFIDISRKTGSELSYQFVPVSENHEFFLFASTILRIA